MRFTPLVPVGRFGTSRYARLLSTTYSRGLLVPYPTNVINDLRTVDLRCLKMRLGGASD